MASSGTTASSTAPHDGDFAGLPNPAPVARLAEPARPVGGWRRGRGSPSRRGCAARLRHLAVGAGPESASPCVERDSRPVRRPRRGARSAGGRGERQEAGRGHARGDDSGCHSPPRCGPGVDRYRDRCRRCAGAMVQHQRGTSRGRRGDRPLEFTRRPADPLARSGPGGGEYGRGENARADRSRSKPGLPDPRRGGVVATGRSTSSPNPETPALRTSSPHPMSR
jgi:hypothetical protein